MNENRLVTPLFLARNSKLSPVRKEVVEAYKIDASFLYQIHIITFLADNLFNCLLVLAGNNGSISDTFGIFDPLEKDKCKDFCYVIYRLFDKQDYDFIQFDKEIITEEKYLDNAAEWIKGKLYL